MATATIRVGDVLYVDAQPSVGDVNVTTPDMTVESSDDTVVAVEQIDETRFALRGVDEGTADVVAAVGAVVSETLTVTVIAADAVDAVTLTVVG